MLTKTQELILAFLLANPEEKVTIRGIAKRLNKSYTLVYNNLIKLEKEEIIKKESVPPAQIVTLNEFAPKELFVDIELKRKKEFLNNNKWIKVMLNDILRSTNIFFILLVFGSYAKEKQTKDSDIDLLVILQNKEEIKSMERVIDNVYTKIKKGVNFIDINDFIEMIKDSNDLNIGNEAKKHHIILHGVEQYYQLLK